MKTRAVILVVEDDADMRRGICESLTAKGYTVDAAEDGLEAVERMESKSCDVVISALKMPRLDGIGLLRKTREVSPQTAFIIVTGYGSTETATEAMRLGAFDYIAKPFDMNQLNSIIEQAIESTHLPEAPKAVARKVVTTAAVPALLEHLMKQAPVLAPVAKGKSHVFAQVERASDVVLDYTTTILPPKKFLLPQLEPLIRFDRETNEAVAVAEEPVERILFGVHPCDMQGILRLDLTFTEGEPESNYLQQRSALRVVGVSCQPDDKCFCQALGAYNTREGFDLFLTKLRRGYLVEVITDKGAALIEGFGELDDASAEDVEEAAAVNRDNARPRQTIGCHARALPELLALASEDPTWKETAERCLSCGSCNLVCPTCFCFDVTDRLQLNLKDGTRYRRWDSCQLEEFAVVATGENFRKERDDMVRHRFAHKLQYFHEKFGTSMCVGCGRCARACTADIDPVEVISQLCKNNEKALLARVCSFAQ